MHLPQRLSEDCVRKEYEEEIKSIENRQRGTERQRKRRAMRESWRAKR